VLDFTHDQLPGRIVFGAGRRDDVPSELESLGASRVLIIGGSHEHEVMEQLAGRVRMPSEMITGVVPHVPAATVRDALTVVDRLGPDVVVTVGGGSATGLGKMVALEREVQLVTIPTTYAGSEMTPIWGTTHGGTKRTGRSLRVLPTTVVYDPELTVDLPKSVTVNSAFNALAHCVESVWLPTTSPITVEAAVSAIRSIVDGVTDVSSDLSDVDARARLLYGAHRAGTVLASAGSGLLHTTAHVLGGMFGLDHGAMYAVLTPPMVEHHLGRIPDAEAPLTAALGPDPSAALTDLARWLDAPRTLAEIGFPSERLAEAIEQVTDRSGVPTEDIERLLTSVAVS
jgi:maleylacetate reductase